MASRLDAIERRCDGDDRYRTYKTDDILDLVAVADAALEYLAAAQNGTSGPEDIDGLVGALAPLLAEEAT